MRAAQYVFPMNKGFLENLYAGQFMPELASPDVPPPDLAKVEGFTDRFRKAVSGFDLRALEGHAMPPALMGALKEMGVFGLIIPREYGGLGFSIPEYLLVIEALAGSDMSLAIIPLAHLSIGVKGILLFGSEAQKRRYLPPAASGQMLFAYALTEPETGSDAQHVRTTAVLEGDGSHYVLEGTKTYITNANYAGAFTVFAQLDPQNPGHMGVFIVERSWDGVAVGHDMPKMGLALSSTAAVRLSGVRVPRDNLIGTPGEGFKIAMTILNYGRLGLGAASSGLLAQSLLDMRKRSASRKQFGVPIADFELIQEKMAHALVHGYAASAMTAFTAALVQKNPLMNVMIESSHCKLYGTTRCWDTLYDAQQTAGGAGFLSTLPYEKRLRDFRVTTLFEGTTEIHSIYPSLTVFRAYGKELRDLGPLGRVARLARIGRTRAMRGMREKEPALRDAARAALRSEALLRSLLTVGLRVHGRRIAQEEFFLRRMTSLSLSLFWLVASVWRLKRAHPDGSYPREDLDVIRYLTAEAREVQASEGRTRASAKEIVHRRIIAALRGSSGAGVE